MDEKCLFIEYFSDPLLTGAPLYQQLNIKKTDHMRKTIHFLLLLVMTTTGVAGLNAQRGGGMNWDPEKRAEQQTANMTEKLSLSEAQTAKVKEINLKYAKKMSEARQSADGDREAMRATMLSIREEQDKELQTVLTEEQWQQWVKFRDERKENRGKGAGKKSKKSE